MSIRFVLGTGTSRVQFTRAEKHTAAWDRQKEGFRLALGLPAHGGRETSLGHGKIS